MNETSSLRRTPLHSCYERAGARLVEFFGWLMPVQYSGLMEEHRAVRSAAGMFDVSHMGEIAVRGAGACDFLQGMTPNNVKRLVPGQAHYSGLLNERAGYLDDVLVYRLAEEEFLLVVNASNIEKDFAWIEKHAPQDVTVEDLSDRYALIALQGPKAETILQRLTETDLASLSYYRFAHGEVAGNAALISRTGYTGEDGFELYLAPEVAAAVWDALTSEGAADGLLPAGLGARDSLRLEAAMALYGNDLDESTTPYEAGLGWVVKLKKGDFVGRDVLQTQKENGTDRKLVGFEVVGRGIARRGHEIVHGGNTVGVVTSGTFSPTLEKAIGLAYLPTELIEPGTELAVEVRGRSLEARVVKIPFYKRS